MVTQQERDALAARLEQLIANRPVISKRIEEARALGDLKENGDYHAAREEQGIQEAEIKRLTQRMASLQVVDDSHRDSGVVFVGSTVEIVEVRILDEDEPKGDGEEEGIDSDGARVRCIRVDEVEIFRLVGEATDGTGSDASITHATVNSPFGEALLKARVGEVIRVRGPRGIKRFKIHQII